MTEDLVQNELGKLGRKLADNRRRIILESIQSGLLDEWISARDLVLKINEGYADSKARYEGKMRKRDRHVSVMQVATILGEFYRKGIVQMNRKSREIALWRKV